MVLNENRAININGHFHFLYHSIDKKNECKLVLYRITCSFHLDGKWGKLLNSPIAAMYNTNTICIVLRKVR